MLSSFTVGAIFTIRDEASAVLTRLADEVARLDALIKNTTRNMVGMSEVRFGNLSRSLGGVERAMGTIEGGATRMAGGFAASMGTMEASMTGVIDRLAAISAEMAAMAAESRVIGRSLMPLTRGPGGPREPGAPSAGGGGHRGSGVYARFHEGPVGAHMGVGPGEIAGLGLAGLDFIGMRGAAQQQLALQYTLQHANIPLDSFEGRQQYKELLQIAEDASRGTVFSNVATAKMMPTAVALSMLPLDQAKPLMMPAIRFGEYEQLMGQSIGKTWAAQENVTGALRFAHLMNIWDPKELEKSLNVLAPLTIATGQSPQQIENTMKYSLPIARSLRMTGEGAAEMTALVSILGLGGTTAGTGLGQALTGMLPRGGAGGAMGARTSRAERERRAILQNMGVVDEHMRSRIVHDGQFDASSWLQALHQYEVAHPDTYMQDFTRIANIRGARVLATLGQEGVQERWQNLQQRTEGFQARGGIMTAQPEIAGASVVQQVERLWANTVSIFTMLNQNLTTTVGLLAGLNAGLEKAREFLAPKPELQNQLGNMAATGAGWGLWNIASRFFPALGGGMFGGLVSRLFPATLIGQSLSAAGLFTPLIPHFSGRIGYEQETFGSAGMGGGMRTAMPFGQFFGASPTDPMEASRLRRLRDPLAQSLDLDYPALARRVAGVPAVSSGFQFRGRAIDGEITPPGEMLPPLNERGSRAGRADRAAAATQQVQAINQVSVPVSVNIQSIPIPQIIAALIGPIIAAVGPAIRAALGNALTHNSGQGGGTHESPGTSGGGTPGYM